MKSFGDMRERDAASPQDRRTLSPRFPLREDDIYACRSREGSVRAIFRVETSAPFVRLFCTSQKTPFFPFKWGENSMPIMNVWSVRGNWAPIHSLLKRQRSCYYTHTPEKSGYTVADLLSSWSSWSLGQKEASKRWHRRTRE